MASLPPSSHRSGLGRIVPAFGLFALFNLAGILAVGEVFHGVMLGAATFLVHRQIIVRAWLLSDHNRGIQLARSRRHAPALSAFQASEAAWTRRAWLDRWRAPLLASAARWGFAAQARYNQALCLHALGHDAEALRLVRGQLVDTPDMAAARALFEHLESQRGETGTAWSVLQHDLDEAPTPDRAGTR